MAQRMMQEHLYGDLLAPTQGYHTDFAMGMTYSLGFDALLTAQLAFGMLGDMDEKAIQVPHLLLEAILKNSDKMVIFCNKGSIDVPPTIRKVYSLLEKNIFEVFDPKNKTANFHPKMWLIKEVNNDNRKDVLIKLIVSSRNMAYSDAIDCIVALTGKVGSKFRIIGGEVLGRAPSIWYTNLDHAKRHEEMILFQHYIPVVYPRYCNFDAIEVCRTEDIPCDYDGLMGVPITFLDKYNPDQFEIVGVSSELAEPRSEIKAWYVSHTEQAHVRTGGDAFYYWKSPLELVRTYDRIVIRRKTTA